ncbi:hypothetical protein V8C86DRAFT_2536921 [Haematococcus lacustris]
MWPAGTRHGMSWKSCVKVEIMGQQSAIVEFVAYNLRSQTCFLHFGFTTRSNMRACEVTAAAAVSLRRSLQHINCPPGPTPALMHFLNLCSLLCEGGQGMRPVSIMAAAAAAAPVCLLVPAPSVPGRPRPPNLRPKPAWHRPATTLSAPRRRRRRQLRLSRLPATSGSPQGHALPAHPAAPQLELPAPPGIAGGAASCTQAKVTPRAAGVQSVSKQWGGRATVGGPQQAGRSRRGEGGPQQADSLRCAEARDHDQHSPGRLSTWNAWLRAQ